MADNDLPKLGASLELETTEYDKSITAAIKQADRLDDRLKDIGGTVETKINVDGSDIDSAYASLLDLEKDADVKVNVSDAELDTAADKVSDLDSAAPTVKVNAEDNELDTAADKVSDIDSAKPDVKISASDKALEAITAKLDQIRDMSVIEVALKLSEKAQEVIEKIADVTGVSTILDVGAAAQTVRGRTGQALPGLEQDIESLYTANYGDSIEQIGDLYTGLLQAGVAQKDLAAAATDTYQALTVAGGDDPLEMFYRMDTLVKNNLVSDLGEAADAIAFFNQQGLNRAGDLNDTIDEYSQTLQDSGLSLGAWFKIQKAGLDNGVRDTDKLADSYKEMFNLTREEVSINMKTGDETDRTKALKSLGLLDEAEAYTSGQLAADEYAAGLLDSLNAVEDPAEQRRLGLAIFGPSMVEDAGLPGLLAADLEDSSELSDAWQGVADEGAAIITDTLASAWAEALRTLQVEIGGFLDDQFDLTDRIKTAKEQFRTFIAELKDGKSVGEAIEISFGIEGVDTALGNIERIFGNLVIELLGVIASVQEFTGHGDVATTTRATQTKLAEGQFAFDIKLANEDELGTIISQAMNRGVEQSKLGEIAGNSIQELLDSGDIDKAQALLDKFVQLSSSSAPIVAPGLGGVDLQDAQAALRDGSLDRIQEQIDKGNLIAPITLDSEGLQQQIDDAQAAINTRAQLDNYGAGRADAGAAKGVNSGRSPGMSAADQWAAMIPPDDVRIKTDDATAAVDNLDTATSTAAANAAQNWSDLNISLTEDTAAIVTALDTTAAKVEELDQRTATALTENTVTSSFDQVRDSADDNFPTVIDWFTRTANEAASFDATVSVHLRSVTKQLNDLNFLALQTIANITSAQALGGGGGVTNNTTNNVTVNNNNSNGANVANSQYDLARMLG